MRVTRGQAVLLWADESFIFKRTTCSSQHQKSLLSCSLFLMIHVKAHIHDDDSKNIKTPPTKYIFNLIYKLLHFSNVNYQKRFTIKKKNCNENMMNFDFFLIYFL